VCVGMEASGHGRWFERLLGELHFELRIGDAAEIRAKRVRKQKTDRRTRKILTERNSDPLGPEFCAGYREVHSEA
jgi:hypothetical protein